MNFGQGGQEKPVLLRQILPREGAAEGHQLGDHQGGRAGASGRRSRGPSGRCQPRALGRRSETRADPPEGRVRQGRACPGVSPAVARARTTRPRPRDPGRPSADRRPSPEEGVGAVVVDLGLGAAAARGRAVRRLLQRCLARGHRRPRPWSPSVPALAPPHSSSAPRAAPPRTVTSRTPGHRERAAQGAGSAGKGSRRLPAGSLESRGCRRLGKGRRCIVGLVVRTPEPRGMPDLVVSDLRVRSSACWEGCLLVAR